MAPTIENSMDAMMAKLNAPPPASATPVSTSQAPTPSAEPASPAAAPATQPEPVAAAEAQTAAAADDEAFKFSDEGGKPPEEPVKAAEPAAAESVVERRASEPEAMAALAALLDDPNAFPGKLQDAFLATTRGQRMMETFKVYRTLEKPPEEGGLGFVPTPEEIQQNFIKAQEYENLRFSYEMGDPKQFFDQFIRVDEQGRPIAGAREIIRNLGNHIVSSAPEYYEDYAAPIRNAVLGKIADEIASMPGGEKDSPQQKAREVAVWTYNNVIAPAYGLSQNDFRGTQAATAPAPDEALRQENLRLKQQQQQINHQAYQQQRADFTFEFNNYVDSLMVKDANEALGSLLNEIPDINVPNGKGGQMSLRDSYHTQFINLSHNAVKANQVRFGEVHRTLARAVEHGFDRNQAQAAANLYAATSRECMRNLRTSFMRDVRNNLQRFRPGQPVGQPNGTATSQPGHVVVNGAQSAAPQQTNGVPERLQGEEQVDYMTRLLSFRTQQASAGAVVNGSRR